MRKSPYKNLIKIKPKKKKRAVPDFKIKLLLILKQNGGKRENERRQMTGTKSECRSEILSK